MTTMLMTNNQQVPVSPPSDPHQVCRKPPLPLPHLWQAGQNRSDNHDHDFDVDDLDKDDNDHDFDSLTKIVRWTRFYSLESTSTLPLPDQKYLCLHWNKDNIYMSTTIPCLYICQQILAILNKNLRLWPEWRVSYESFNISWRALIDEGPARVPCHAMSCQRGMPCHAMPGQCTGSLPASPIVDFFRQICRFWEFNKLFPSDKKSYEKWEIVCFCINRKDVEVGNIFQEQMAADIHSYHRRKWDQCIAKGNVFAHFFYFLKQRESEFISVPHIQHTSWPERKNQIKQSY